METINTNNINKENNNDNILIELRKYMLNENNIKKSLLFKNEPTEKPKHIEKPKEKEIEIEIMKPKQISIPKETQIEKLLNSAKTNAKVKSNQIQEKVKEKEKYQLFIPSEKDSLFWCFYAMKNGEASYEMIDNRNFIIEKKIKFEYIDKIRKEKQILKTYKIATLTHIEDNLANDSKIDIKTFISLCVLENLNVIYANKNTYYELLMNDTKLIHIIYSLNNYKFGYEIDTTNNYEKIKNTLYRIENIDKPIKCITSYKVCDLVSMCEKLSIKIINDITNKNKSKKELYELLIQYF